MGQEKIVVSSAKLAPTWSLAQFVINQLLDELIVQVTVGERTYDGYVHQLDFGRGSNFVFASVFVSGLDEHVRVGIRRDGTVDVLPNDDK